jgi:hypothetical protein
MTCREDGLTSILRGFKRRINHFSKKINFKKYTIHWKWAFRYQWIISKYERKNKHGYKTTAKIF